MTAGMTFSLLSFASTRMGGLAASRSQTSWATYWKCHLYFPESRSTATMESVYRLSPGRSAPYRFGDGLTTTMKLVRVFKFTAGGLLASTARGGSLFLPFRSRAFHRGL